MLKYSLHHGDNVATLKTYAADTFDSIICDPPYGIDFLGKAWDANTGSLDLYKECLRVLKPGGYILAFSAARTYHRLATTIELAGFEIRDQIMWLYSSGFPKAQDIGKAIQKRVGVSETKAYATNAPRNGGNQTIEAYAMCSQETIVTSPIAKEWEGWKTALKPSHEPIVLARKPYKGSTIDNVLKNGLGAMNIDATRVPWADENDAANIQNAFGHERIDELYGRDGSPSFQGTEKKKNRPLKKSDRPAGVKMHKVNKAFETEVVTRDNLDGQLDILAMPHDGGRYPGNVIGEVSEGYQKYFYCPKVSRKERHIGFDTNEVETTLDKVTSDGGYFVDDKGNRVSGVTTSYWTQETGIVKVHGATHEIAKIREARGLPIPNIGNNHPTVKPQALMDYLIKLITPPSTPTLQRKVLDPFMGSGSTGMAATKLGHEFVGCDLDINYINISKTRIEAWNDTGLDKTLFGDAE